MDSGRARVPRLEKRARSGAARAWQATLDKSKPDALLMGAALTQAQSWLAKRREDLPGIDRDFIDQSGERERKARARARRVQTLVYLLLVGIILALTGVINRCIGTGLCALTGWRTSTPMCSNPRPSGR
jgi:hypothetical protein